MFDPDDFKDPVVAAGHIRTVIDRHWTHVDSAVFESLIQKDFVANERANQNNQPDYEAEQVHVNMRRWSDDECVQFLDTLFGLEEGMRLARIHLKQRQDI
jgi:hypothetical protein